MSVFDEKWDFSIDIIQLESKLYKDYEYAMNSFKERVLQIMNESFIEINRVNPSEDILNKSDDDLRDYVEKNKNLRNEINNKQQELTVKQGQYENFKKDQKLLSQEIKETHEAFLMAKKYYRKFLRIYYSVENRKSDHQTLYLQFFSDTKKDTENYSVRFARHSKHYEIIDMKPKLEIFKKISKSKVDINDVPNTLCVIRQAFVKSKTKK